MSEYLKDYAIYLPLTILLTEEIRSWFADRVHQTVRDIAVPLIAYCMALLAILVDRLQADAAFTLTDAVSGVVVGIAAVNAVRIAGRLMDRTNPEKLPPQGE